MIKNKVSFRQLLLLVLAALTLTVWGLSQNKQISAANSDNQWITSASLEDTSNNNTQPYGPTDNMKVTYGFKIPQGAITEGNRDSSVVLPEQFNILSNFTFEIKDKDGKVVAEGTTDSATRRITIHYTDLAISMSTKNSIEGSFNITLHWNLDKVNVKKKTVIDWNLPDNDGTKPNSDTVIVNPATTPDSDEKLKKWSWYDPQNPTYLHWCVRVNYSRTHIDNAVVKDVLAANQKLIGTFKIIKVKYHEDGTNFDTLATIDPATFVKDSDTTFHGRLGDIDDTYLIYYESQLTDGGAQKVYGNTATLTGDNIKTESHYVDSPSYSAGGNADYHGGGDTPSTPDVPNTPAVPSTPTPATPATPENSNNSNGSQAQSGTSSNAKAQPLPQTAKTAASWLSISLIAVVASFGLYKMSNKK
ncbi:collagen binding domain-containing protein [Fructobacillus durionis]|uniref:Collagen binding domain-containing protein n=1 Tax=Fructobacillus durionis TaxID=283737 RepID=A0A1I1G2N2_9LACO|nr:collagen binding domain-containing protein [Fructobacillus durionis]SFC05795.1 Collagen binding domain-containing protein [Fructobacillus durionis]